MVDKAREQAVVQAGRIANRAERQAFWTSVMLDSKERTTDRLKAAELLGRSEADFTENVNHAITDSFATLLAEAQKRERSQ
ncbi:MAG: hypothetical protein Q8K32_09385 [Archangium sp.]|nr:hypothetical protein [Archangium sp.]